MASLIGLIFSRKDLCLRAVLCYFSQLMPILNKGSIPRFLKITMFLSRTKDFPNVQIEFVKPFKEVRCRSRSGFRLFLWCDAISLSLIIIYLSSQRSLLLYYYFINNSCHRVWLSQHEFTNKASILAWRTFLMTSFKKLKK